MLGHDQLTVLLTSGLNDCYWSFALEMNTLSVISVNSVTSACCKLHFCQDFAFAISSVLIFVVVLLPVAKQRIFNRSSLFHVTN